MSSSAPSPIAKPLKPLRGVRVLSLALNLPGPAAFMRLKAMGASCLKAEPPGPKGAPAGTSGDPEAPFDCCRAAQNFMLAAHASALGTCWVGAPLPWLHSPGIAQELGLPPGFEPMAVIVVGHPAEQPHGSPRPPPPISWC